MHDVVEADYATLHDTTLRYTAVHCTALQGTALHTLSNVQIKCSRAERCTPAFTRVLFCYSATPLPHKQRGLCLPLCLLKIHNHMTTIKKKKNVPFNLQHWQ